MGNNRRRVEKERHHCTASGFFVLMRNTIPLLVLSNRQYRQF